VLHRAGEIGHHRSTIAFLLLYSASPPPGKPITPTHVPAVSRNCPRVTVFLATG
jgi:hypothetical protein